MFRQMAEFENFVNRQDIEIISTDVKVVEQCASFQEGFCALIFYYEPEDIVRDKEEKRMAVAEDREEKEKLAKEDGREDWWNYSKDEEGIWWYSDFCDNKEYTE